MKTPLSFLLLFYLLLNLFQSPVYSQCQADWQWAKGFKGATGDDWPVAITTDKWNNVIVACTTRTKYITIDSVYMPSANIVVTKFNSSGKLLWVKKFAGGEPHGLVADQNGNIYMAGLFWGGLVCNEFTIIKYPSSSFEGFLVKISADGKALWGRKASDNNRSQSMVFMGQGLAIDTIRNKLVFAGSFNGTKLIADNLTLSHSTSSESINEGFLLVYDTSGKAEWGKVFSTNDDLMIFGVATDRFGNIYASGYFVLGMKIDTFTANNNGLIGSMFCVKLNNKGKVQWLRTSKKGDVRTYEMHTDIDANVYMVGEMYHCPIEIDTFNFTFCSVFGSAGMVIKIDSNGNYKWVKAILGSKKPTGSSPVFSIALDDIGNSFGIGYNSSDSLFIDSLRLRKLSGHAQGSQPFIFKFNKDGRLVWLFRPYPTDTTADAFLDCYKGFCISLDKQGNVFPAFGWQGTSTISLMKIVLGKDSIAMSSGTYQLDVVMGKIRNNFTAVAKGQQITCHSSNNGSARLYISGGEPPFTINWSNSSHQQELKNLSRGWYKVTVTDANSCAVKDSIEIKEPPQLFISITSKQDSAGLHKGEATATVSGGTPPYSYLWNDAGSQKTAKATGLAKGSFTVTVSDKNGCIADTTINLTDVSDIEEMLNINVKVYPNPVIKGLLNIEISNLPARITLKLYDSLGKEVFKSEIKSGINYQDQIPLPGKGLYILKIDMDGKVITKDIVVQ